MIYTVTLNTTLDLVYETPQISKNEINKTELKVLSVGGKGINISRALRSLEVESQAFGFYGGQMKELLLTKLATEGILNHLIQIKGNTRTNLKIIENNLKNVVEFNEIGPKILLEELEAILKLIKNKCTRGDFLVLAGSLPQDVPADFYKDIINIVQKKDTQVLLDTSGDPLRQGIRAGPDFLKVNFEEIRAIKAGGDLETLIRGLSKAGIKKIMVTDGAKRVLYWDGTRVLSAVPPKVEGAASVGSGDSVDAGMIYSIIKGFDPINLLKTSVACGTANLLTYAPGQIDKKKVKNLTRDITVKEL